MNSFPQLEKDLLDIGLNIEAVERMISLCRNLRQFEREEKPKMKTTAQRVRQLESLSLRARELREELERLDVGQWMFLDTRLALQTPCPEEVPQAKGTKTILGSHAVYMQRMLCILAAAASSASGTVAGDRDPSTLGGRKATLGAYAGYIGGIAVIVKDAGIKAGRGGVFERICEKVFDAAGIPSKPEGALRHYLKTLHHEYQKLGHVL